LQEPLPILASSLAWEEGSFCPDSSLLLSEPTSPSGLHAPRLRDQPDRAVASFIRHSVFQNGHVVWKAVVTIGLASVAGGLLGANIAGAAGKILRQIFAAVVLLLPCVSLRGQRQSRDAFAFLRWSAGFLWGWYRRCGCGRSALHTDHALIRSSFEEAWGHPVTIVITALAAGRIYFQRMKFTAGGTLGYVDWPCASAHRRLIPLAAVGAHIANKTKVTVLKRIFALFLLVIAFRMLLF
jgi:uncharacterized membrane protein YfcA